LITYGPSVTDGDDVIDQLTAAAGEIEARNDGILVGSAELGLVYVYLRPMSSWAFTPWNQETLELLNHRFAISTAVLSPGEERRLGAGALNSVGLNLTGNLTVLDRTYHVFVDRKTGDSLELGELLLQQLSTTTPQGRVARHIASSAAASRENPRRESEGHEVAAQSQAEVTRL